jgi:hypothetical protein
LRAPASFARDASGSTKARAARRAWSVGACDVADANELLRINHEVTSERDPGKRRAAIERAYVEDLRFIYPAGEVVGRQAFSDRVQ